MKTGSHEQEYILGTHEEEIERLGLQHRVWRPRALDAWRRAGFRSGQTILDIGCGPGYASLDLAEIVGPGGRVIALDRSRRFLDALESAKTKRGLPWITTSEIELDAMSIPATGADGGWARWVFAFVRDPRGLLERVRDALKPGGAFVIHEYFDYRTWRFSPACPALEEFVLAVMESWRSEGGEPDIGLALTPWLREAGFSVRELHPIIDVVQKSSQVWEWPDAFVRSGLHRLVELGRMAADRANAIADEIASAGSSPDTLLVTPAVIEIIAERT